MTIFDRVQSPVDSGTFTIQSVDIPLGAKTKTKPRFTKAEVQRKKARLTPINEYDEFDKVDFETKSVLSFDSLKCNEDLAMDHATRYFDIDNDLLCHQINEKAFHDRSDTPMELSRRKKKTSRIEEKFEEELRMITEQSEYDCDDSACNGISDLPPRPKARLEVLPPDITGNHNHEYKKKRRVRRLRQKVNEVGGTAYKASIISNSVSDLKPLQDAVKPKKASLLTRPQSADSGVRIIQSCTLPKIHKSKSTSVPDLPTIMNKLAKTKVKGDLRNSYEENGSLGTPRGAVGKRTNTKCLLGSDMASFYNMWEKTRISRVIGRQSPDKTNTPSPTFQRPCASLHKHEARRHHFLPPL